MVPARLKRSWTPSGYLAPRQEEEEDAAAVTAAPHGKLRAHSPPIGGLCDRSAPHSIVGREERRPEAELRVRFCRGRPRGDWDGTWEKHYTQHVTLLTYLAPFRLRQA